MRALGIDVGRKRVGLAISDPSGTLARPLETLTFGQNAQPSTLAERVAAAVAALAAEDDGLVTIVVGKPLHLDGTESDETARVAAFVDALRTRTTVPIVQEDERLTSREAESRIAQREPDWRKRKQKLDAAAAAVILQDYLDKK